MTNIIGARKLDWDDALDDSINLLENIPLPDLLIAADIIYDDTLFTGLCRTVDSIFSTCGDKCSLILVNAVRNEETQRKFFEELGKYILTKSPRSITENYLLSVSPFSASIYFQHLSISPPPSKI